MNNARHYKGYPLHIISNLHNNFEMPATTTDTYLSASSAPISHLDPGKTLIFSQVVWLGLTAPLSSFLIVLVIGSGKVMWSGESQWEARKMSGGPYEEEVPVGAAQGDVHPFYVNCDRKVRTWDVISATMREATLRIQLPLKTKITENHKKYSYIPWWEYEALTRSSHTWNEWLPKFSVKETNSCCYLSQQFRHCHQLFPNWQSAVFFIFQLRIWELKKLNYVFDHTVDI